MHLKNIRKILTASTIAALMLITAAPAAPLTAVAYPITRATPTEYPYVVSILHNPAPGVYAPEFRCSGALIDRYFVVTAAHCVSDENLQPEQLLVGHGGESHDSMSSYGVIGFAIHPRYTVAVTNQDVALPHDLALVHLAEPIEGPYLQLTGQNDKGLLKGKNGLRFYGWGEDQNGRTSPLLGVTRQTDMSRSGKRWYISFNPKLQIAAGWKIRGENLYSIPCYGDSGGPLVGFAKGKSPRLLGIVSYGAESCRTAAPVVYTRISAYLSWLKEARTALAATAAATRLIYISDDALGDATGSWQAAELASGAVTADGEYTVLFAEMLTENWSDFAYEMHAVLESYTNDGTFEADGTGLYDEEGALLCPASSTYGKEDGTGYHGLWIATTCLVEAVGTTFDASIWLRSASTSVYLPGESEDGVRVEYVIAPKL